MAQFLRPIRTYGPSFILFGYIGLCVMLGGAGREGHYWHGALQALAAVGSAILILAWPRHLALGNTKLPLLILTSIATLGVLQTIALPYEVWTSLPGRAIVFEGYEAIGFRGEPLPVSLDADATLATIGYAITPIFVILLCLRIGIKRLRGSAPWFFCAVGFAALLLGLLQVFNGEDGVLYFYDFTSPGAPVGFFSNVNHQATLLLMVMPFTFMLLMQAISKGQAGEDQTATITLMLGLLFLILVGVLSAGSVAGYLLLAPVLGLSFMAANKSRSTSSNVFVGLSVLVLVVLSIVLVMFSPVLENLGVTSFSSSDVSRFGIWQTTLKGIEALWPIGSGIGTYESVIPVYEDPDVVTSVFVAKAHNEYLQVVMEGGLVGLIILLVALIWFGRTVAEVWTVAKSSQPNLLVRKSGSIALVVIVLHSLVDYPSRTPAIAALIGLAVALLCMQTPRPGAPKPVVSDNPKRVVI